MREVKHLIPASRAELIAKARERVEQRQIESQADLDRLEVSLDTQPESS